MLTNMGFHKYGFKLTNPNTLEREEPCPFEDGPISFEGQKTSSMQSIFLRSLWFQPGLSEVRPDQTVFLGLSFSVKERPEDSSDFFRFEFIRNGGPDFEPRLNLVQVVVAFQPRDLFTDIERLEAAYHRLAEPERAPFTPNRNYIPPMQSVRDPKTGELILRPGASPL